MATPEKRSVIPTEAVQPRSRGTPRHLLLSFRSVRRPRRMRRNLLLLRRDARSLIPVPCNNERMANLTLVYGMRLLPADEVASVGEAPVNLKNGNQAHVTMHVLEGSREQIEAQLRHSIDAFFDFYPEI